VTIAESGVRAGQTGAGWRLALARAGAAPEVTLTRAQLLAMPQHRYQASTTHPPAAHSPDATPAGSPAPTPADDASHAPDPDPGTNPKK
jgi:hypothetical protein